MDADSYPVARSVPAAPVYRLECGEVWFQVDSADGSVSAGARLDLAFLVSRIDGTACTPFEAALVDVWHCDAQGLYSGFPGQGDGHDVDTSGQKFLRGFSTAT